MTSSVNDKLSSIGINKATSSSINGITTLVDEITIFVTPTPSCQSNAQDSNCEENSSSWSTIGVGFLLFTNIITVIVFIISCLWLLRRKHKKL